MRYNIARVFRGLKNCSHFNFWKSPLILGLVIISVVLIFYYLRPHPLPQIIIWAWERPENLLFINNKNIKVAFYAGSINFSDSETIFKPRLQPLAINPDTPVIAVIRIVNNERDNPLGRKQLSEAVDLIVENCLQEGIGSCQIDFDVKNSEIDFYKELIFETRDNLPKSIPLSITTLVSWCHLGSWLEDLPVEEVVPMFYRLGPDENLIRQDLVGESFMGAEICQRAIGISVDEPLPQTKYLKNRRIYIFNPDPWTSNDFLNIIKKIKAETAKTNKSNQEF